jgi:hypothetical protein
LKFFQKVVKTVNPQSKKPNQTQARETHATHKHLTNNMAKKHSITKSLRENLKGSQRTKDL